MKDYRWKLTIKGGPGSGNWGHAGRPGLIGGSQPGGGHHMVAHPDIDGAAASKNNREIDKLFNEASDRGKWEHASGTARGAIKDALVTEISKRADVSYDKVNNIIRQWAASSNDTDMRSLALQRDAAKEFGQPLSDFTKARIKVATDSSTGYNPHPLYDSATQRKTLRAMYEHTQDTLKKMGIGPDDRVLLYRGSSYQTKGTRRATFHGNTLESWTVSRKIADEFAERGYGDTFVTSIPARSILSLATTGLGCLTEGEVVTVSTEGIVDILGD